MRGANGREFSPIFAHVQAKRGPGSRKKSPFCFLHELAHRLLFVRNSFAGHCCSRNADFEIVQRPACSQSRTLLFDANLVAGAFFLDKDLVIAVALVSEAQRILAIAIDSPEAALLGVFIAQSLYGDRYRLATARGTGLSLTLRQQRCCAYGKKDQKS